MISELSTPPEAVRGLQRVGRTFWNPTERRLRAGWRLLVHGLALAAVAIAAGLLIAAALLALEQVAPATATRLGALSSTSGPLLAIYLLLSGALVTLITWLARRLLDRRSFASLGFQQRGFAVRDLCFGVALAGAMMAATFGILQACGWLRVERLAWEQSSPGAILASLAGWALSFAAVGWYEELLSRGYWLVNLREGIGLRSAVAVSSSVFALGHVGNPNATPVSTIALIGAGVFLAWPVLRTGQLWMSIGLHLGWNFFEGPVFGFAVSGMPTFRLIEHQVSGPAFLTGGAFGPEAGLLLLGFQGLGAVTIVFATRGRLAAPRPTSA